jgi:carbamate kinase
LRRSKGWVFHADGDAYRRVVPSPRPKRIFELDQIGWMLEHDAVVICAGGGGIPTMYDEEGQLVGIEAVIDKDHASGLLARDLGADYFILATDADAVYLDWGKPKQRPIASAHPDALMEMVDEFPVGSMGPKVVAACEFATETGNTAGIGGLTDIDEMLAGTAGTVVTTQQPGIVFRDETV